MSAGTALVRLPAIAHSTQSTQAPCAIMNTTTNENPALPLTCSTSRCPIVLTLVTTLLAACSTTTAWVVDSRYEGPVAIVVPRGTVDLWQALFTRAANTQIQSVDGSGSADQYLVSPGLHTFQVRLSNHRMFAPSYEFEGSCILRVPAGDFELAAEMVGDEFEVRLLAADGSLSSDLRVPAERSPMTQPWLPPLGGLSFRF